MGSIAETYATYPNTGPVLPAMGYGKEQIRELEATIRATPAERVIIATPVNLAHLIDIDRPTHRVRYELQVIGAPTLEEILQARLEGVESLGR